MLKTFIPEDLRTARDRAILLGASSPALCRELAEGVDNLLELLENGRERLRRIKEKLEEAEIERDEISSDESRAREHGRELASQLEHVRKAGHFEPSSCDTCAAIAGRKRAAA